MVSCRECGKELAEKTDAWPQCGALDPEADDYAPPVILYKT